MTMTEQEMNTLITKMEDIFPTREDLLSFQKKIEQRLDGIEKDLKSVVRIYNLDEEMSAVYERIQRLEQKTGISSA